MKTIKLLQMMVLLLALSFSAGNCSCIEEALTKESEVLDTLPPETQTGANTFGCYLNGTLRAVQKKYEGTMYAGYNSDNRVLRIGCGGTIGVMWIEIFHPRERFENLEFEVKFEPKRDILYMKDYTENSGEIYLTKLDVRYSGIVSGVFSDITLRGSNKKDTIFVTQGRFDMRLDRW